MIIAKPQARSHPRSRNWSAGSAAQAPGPLQVRAATANRNTPVGCKPAEFPPRPREPAEAACNPGSLVAAAVTLRLARRTAHADPGGSAVLLGDLADQLQDAIGEIRRLARGIYPPVLAANGLPAALPAAAAKAGLPTAVHLDGIGRYPPQIEAAVYFCCLEALNNAAKHAGARARATITARQAATTLTVTITDTGRGYNPASTSHGTGLTNIADRLAVHAGTLHIRTQQNHGTTVTLQIPTTTPATPQ